MTKTKSPRMTSLVDLYDMQSNFFISALEGINEKDTHIRLNTKANHIAWLTGSLVEQRFELAQILGIPDKQDAHKLFENNQGIKDDMRYPDLASFRSAWNTISPKLRSALIAVADEKLDTKIDLGNMQMSIYELLSFSIYREANCIGQIALWRRLLGYEAMKYM